MVPSVVVVRLALMVYMATYVCEQKSGDGDALVRCGVVIVVKAVVVLVVVTSVASLVAVEWVVVLVVTVG